MFDTGSDSSNRVRRLLRAAMSVTPPPPPPNLRSSHSTPRWPTMTRASVFRRSPLLLLAAALMALAVVHVHDARPAEAQSNTIWSATLTVADKGSGFLGCNGAGDCSTALTDNDFTYGNTNYRFTQIISNSGLIFALDKTIPLSLLASATLIVDGREVPLAGHQRSNLGGVQTQLTPLPSGSGLSWSVGDTVQLSLEVESLEVAVSADGPLREGGPPVNVTFTMNRPAPTNLHATLGHNDSVRFNADGPRFATNATRAVMELSVPQDQIDNNCRTLHLQVWFLPYVGGEQLQADVAFTVIDDDGTADTCSGLLGSPYPTQLSLQFVEASRWTEKIRVTYLPQLDRPPLNRNVVSVSASSDQITQRDGFSGADGDYYVPRDQFSIWAPHTNPTYTNARGTHDWPIEIWIWDSAPDHAIITLDVTTEHPALSTTVNVPVNAMRGLANRQSSDGGGVQGSDGDPAQPTAVTLSLDAATVSEDAGDVTLTVTLDAPAPEGGIGGFLFAGDDGTATADVDFTLPFSIFIPGGERSATATVSIIDDDLDEADETVVLSALFDMGTALLEDKITLTITDNDACDSCGGEGGTGAVQQPQTPQEKYADLIADMKEWRDDPCCAHNKAHTDRWDRVLLAFGETVSDASLTPMTATEAQGYADRGWTRWERVADALAELEAAPQSDPPNSAPTVASAIDDATIVNESGTQTVSLSGVFSDADSDALTISAASSNEAVATVSVAADHSSLTVTAKSRGTATITVTADDGNGGTVSDAFTVNVKAAPVVASALADVSMEEEETRDISLSGVFSDADRDTLTITVASSDAAVDALEFQGTLTLVAVSAGTSTITVAATDSDGNAVSDSFDVTVTAPQQQDPPPADDQDEETSNGTLTVSAPLDDISLQGSQSREIALAGVFSGDALTITAASSNYGVASVWVDGSTLTVVGTGAGTATITATAEDADGNTVSDEFEVTVSPAS